MFFPFCFQKAGGLNQCIAVALETIFLDTGVNSMFKAFNYVNVRSVAWCCKED